MEELKGISIFLSMCHNIKFLNVMGITYFVVCQFRWRVQHLEAILKYQPWMAAEAELRFHPEANLEGK